MNILQNEIGGGASRINTYLADLNATVKYKRVVPAYFIFIDLLLVNWKKMGKSNTIKAKDTKTLSFIKPNEKVLVEL